MNRGRRAAETAFAPTSTGDSNHGCQITSASHVTFTVGTAGPAFTVHTGWVGSPFGHARRFAFVPVVSPPCQLLETGALPSGVTFTNNGTGTATLTGTPAPGTGGTYPFTITAANGYGPAATQIFILTVDQACQITSPATDTFTVGTPGTFTVQSTGTPNCALTVPPLTTLPSGVTFIDNGDGTATLAGTPTTGGPYPFTITATNGVGLAATLDFTLTVNQPCQITSDAAATFDVGQSGSFTVYSSGPPTCTLTEPRHLPSGVTFVDNGDGTATISGTPAAHTVGPYLLEITATNVVGSDTQYFLLTVLQAPTITSASTLTCIVGQACTTTVTSTGVPNAALSETGALPSGVTFTDNLDGTATLSGTPAAHMGGTYPLTITATNTRSPDATQSFTLTVVNGRPAAPSSLVATRTGQTVVLTWTNNATLTSSAAVIWIQRSTSAGFTTFTNIPVGPAAITYTDTKVVGGTRYYYRVLAWNAAGYSAWSNVASP